MAFNAYIVRRRADAVVVYCGITTRSVEKRWQQHCYAAPKSRYLLQRKISAHGADAFEVEHVASATSFENLKALEIILIDQFGTFSPGGFNLTRGGEGVLGLRFSEETLRRLGEARRGRVWTEEQKLRLRKTRSRTPHPFLGRQHTPEARAKVSKKRKGVSVGEKNHFFGRKHTPETIKRISGPNNHRHGKKWTPEQRAERSGPGNPRFGQTQAPITREKIADAQRGAKNHNFGKPWSDERRAKQMVAIAARRERASKT